MYKSKFFIVLTTVLFFSSIYKTRAQNNSIAIVLNEYCVGNYAIADNYGYTSDWVEIHNNFTSSVTLSGYFLSNDKTNLYKWKFPATFTLGVNSFSVVYLSGRNVTDQTGGAFFHHANFNIDQCKNQWLILTTPQGVVRDSVFIQKTKAGHTRGRIDYNILGIDGWRLYPLHSFGLGNPNSGYYKGYLPTPTFTPQAGWGHNGETIDMFLPGTIQGLNTPYSSADTNNCYQIYYTTDGSYPVPGAPGTAAYTYTDPPCDGGTSPIIILENQIFRAVTYPKVPGGPCDAFPQNNGGADPFLPCIPDVNYWLPSFCETNTYFSESNGSFDNFDTRFGVLSVATNFTADVNWFNSGGSNNPANTPYGHVEYFEGKSQKVEGYTQLHRPPNESWATAQRGFLLSIDDRRGFGCNFEGNIFNDACLGTSSRTVFPTLHVHAGDNESHSLPNGAPATDVSKGTGIRDVFMQSLALKYNLNVNPLHMKPVITFVNGKYWGAYNLREVYDKYYEAYYHGQLKDSLYLQYYHNIDGFVYNYIDDTQSSMQPLSKFKTEVFDYIYNRAMSSTSFYNTAMGRLDKESFIDYMILNGYAMNSDLWNYNVGFGRGTSQTKNGDKWHYYLWNTPAVFNFTAVNTNTLSYNTPFVSPCISYSAPITYTAASSLGGNAHGMIMRKLMDPILGSPAFQLEYKNRYQDLMNGALKCDKILAHFDCVVNLFAKEMRYHEDQSSIPTGQFSLSVPAGTWDTNIVYLRKVIEKRCGYMATSFSLSGCFNMDLYNPITVDVYPEGSGTVKLNSIVLPNYKWDGTYWATQLAFKAAPTSTNYVFHHWEFKNHVTKNNAPLSLDSVAIDFNRSDEVLAVFTDITNDIDMPTGFTPNGDGNNDEFKPLGSALFTTEYEFRVWNRWGQEVFRSTDPGKGWDGYYQNAQSLSGVYAYVITYKNVYNEPKVKKGNVTLVR